VRYTAVCSNAVSLKGLRPVRREMSRQRQRQFIMHHEHNFSGASGAGGSGNGSSGISAISAPPSPTKQKG
jgi:hypothetical protein